MKFLITMTDIAGQWDKLSNERQQEILEKHREFQYALEEAGVFVDALHLHSRDEAVTVRMEGNKVAVTEGPYSDADEYMGGAYIIDVKSLEDAVAWAKKGRFLPGANEVRQITL